MLKKLLSLSTQSLSFHQSVNKTYTLAFAVIIFYAEADHGWEKGENRNQVGLEELLAPGHATIWRQTNERHWLDVKFD